MRGLYYFLFNFLFFFLHSPQIGVYLQTSNKIMGTYSYKSAEKDHHLKVPDSGKRYPKCLSTISFPACFFQGSLSTRSLRVLGKFSMVVETAPLGTAQNTRDPSSPVHLMKTHLLFYHVLLILFFFLALLFTSFFSMLFLC